MKSSYRHLFDLTGKVAVVTGDWASSAAASAVVWLSMVRMSRWSTLTKAAAWSWRHNLPEM